MLTLFCYNLFLLCVTMLSTETTFAITHVVIIIIGKGHTLDQEKNVGPAAVTADEYSRYKQHCQSCN